jgi:hypothetical protein
MRRVEQKDGQQRPEERAGVVANALKAEGLPRSFSSTDDAMSASRGAERAPAPSRSSNRAPNTPCQTVESPISGLAIAASS